MNIDYVFKKCTKCGEWLVASSEFFHKDKTGKYGLKAICKECNKKYREANKETIAKRKKKWDEENKETKAEYNKKHYEANKEAIAERGKKYYEENKEVIAKRHKEYYEENKETIAEYHKKYREENKEAVAKRHKEWYEENKEASAEYHKEYNKTPQGQVVAFNSRNRRRAKEQNQGRGVTAEQWLEMMNFFGWRCAYSGKYIGGDSKDRTIDHIDPLNNGGENEIWNCVPMDKGLNSSKHDKEMLDWYIKQPFCTAERLLKIYNWQEYARNKYDNSIVNE